MEHNDTVLSNDSRKDNLTTTDDRDRWWVPLAVALPVCLVGIVLVTILVLVAITCYRSKFKYKKQNSESDGKLNDENTIQNETTCTGVFHSTYANMNETLRETKNRPTAMAHESHSNGGKRISNGIWKTKSSWKERNGHVTSINSAFSNSLEDEDLQSRTSGSSEKTADEKEVKTPEEGKAIVGDFLGFRAALAELKGKALKSHSTGVGSNPTPGNKQLNGPVAVKRIRSEEPTQDFDKDGTKIPRKPNHAENRKTFVVMYSMESNDDAQLPLSVNDVIFFLDEERDGWMKGEKKESGEVGWFPRSHVREGMSPLAKRHSVSKMEGLELKEAKPIDFTALMGSEEVTVKMENHDNDTDDFDDDDDDDDYETGIEYQALYPYRALEEGDINFDAGDVIVVVEKLENGWWRGYHGDVQGFFPGSYVQLKCDEKTSLAMGDMSLKEGELPSPTEDISRSVTELLPTSAVSEEADDDDDDEVSDKKKKKNLKARRSLGVFLMSIPRKMNAVGRAGGGGVSPGPGSPMTDKTKKGERALPWVKKKKKPNAPPFVRRCSLAPGPPSSGQKTGTAASSTAQMAAETGQQKHTLDTTYEEIGTNLLGDWRLDSGPDVSGPSLVESIGRELRTREETGRFYANLSIAGEATDPSGERKVGETRIRTEDSPLPVWPVSTDALTPGKPSKPVPPQKPNFSGSTPNIAALMNSSESRTVLAKRSPKPNLVTKPIRDGTEDVLERDVAVLPKATKPKPLTAKPKHLTHGLPAAPGTGRSTAPMRRELCRSLDSVLLPGAETEKEEEEEEGELEIVKWIQRKLFAEEEQTGSTHRNEVESFARLKTADRPNVDELQRKSPNITPQRQSDIEATKSDESQRISLLRQHLSQCGLEEESFA